MLSLYDFKTYNLIERLFIERPRQAVDFEFAMLWYVSRGFFDPIDIPRNPLSGHLLLHCTYLFGREKSQYKS